GVLRVERPNDLKRSRELHGLTRTLINNMVVGVTTGYRKGLEITGVGYRAQLVGQKLQLSLGYSHPIEIDPPAGIAFEVENPTRLAVTGIDKELVGHVAARVRAQRKPEPYKGKGGRYAGEGVRRKAGKAGKIGGKKCPAARPPEEPLPCLPRPAAGPPARSATNASASGWRATRRARDG